jgi:hypothetical protein
MGGSSIESGKHHYNSQQGSSKWLCSFEETFLTFWRGVLANETRTCHTIDSFEGVFGLYG